jgi:hypothetical protein
VAQSIRADQHGALVGAHPGDILQPPGARRAGGHAGREQAPLDARGAQVALDRRVVPELVSRSTIPLSSRLIALVGQAFRHGASEQCRQTEGISTPEPSRA